MNAKLKKPDLFIRVISSIVMIFLGAVFLGIGGTVFKAILIVISAILAWEILSFNNLQKHTKNINCFIFCTYICNIHFIFSNIIINFINYFFDFL